MTLFTRQLFTGCLQWQCASLNCQEIRTTPVLAGYEQYAKQDG